VTICTLALVDINSNAAAREGQRVVIQGYGKVGAPLVKLLSERGMKVVGLADIHGAIHVPEGIDPEKMTVHFDEAKSIMGYPACRRDSRRSTLRTARATSLFPRPLVASSPNTSPSTMSASMMVEAANGPTTGEGAAVLS
jgi:glutamate dehydrogenase/leucine dehydrogenase